MRQADRMGPVFASKAPEGSLFAAKLPQGREIPQS